MYVLKKFGLHEMPQIVLPPGIYALLLIVSQPKRQLFILANQRAMSYADKPITSWDYQMDFVFIVGEQDH